MNRTFRRKAANIVFVSLCVLATLIALAALGLILWSLFRQGLGAMNLDIFTMDTPAPDSEGGLRNAIYGSILMGAVGMVIALVVVTGFLKHGIGFLKLFVPHAPWYLLILLVPIEVISFLTRPISLSVRLFANMLAGHTMLAVFGGFVVSLGAAGGIFTGLAVAPMLLIIAIMLLELLVAFLQAYVFAILTCIYLNEALHLHDHH